MEALEDPDCPVACIYDLKYAIKMNKIVDNFSGGFALFADPAAPIKCAGAPHKILFLSADRWIKKGIRNNIQIEFHKGLGVYFSQPKYAENLAMLHEQRNNKVVLNSNLVKVDGKQRIAYLQDTKTKAIKEIKFDLLHFAPPQPPHKFIQESGLAGAGGYVDVDQGSLRHKKFKNVWALGDNAGLPTSKTAAALMSQGITLTKNLMRQWKNKEEPREVYNGYTSCPIFVGGNKLMLCEFKYNSDLDETFLVGKQHIPRNFFFIVKRYMFPWVYFYLMPRGLWLGNKGIGITSYLK